MAARNSQLLLSDSAPRQRPNTLAFLAGNLMLLPQTSKPGHTMAMIAFSALQTRKSGRQPSVSTTGLATRWTVDWRWTRKRSFSQGMAKGLVSTLTLAPRHSSHSLHSTHLGTVPLPQSPYTKKTPPAYYKLAKRILRSHYTLA